ncbi:caffeoylshikimate esterase-like [Bidens hawaiensis]|uniref:caffeoylshikimate esterase-like n=1 Tax=Bidens hawaiensis TaxID=980011 RepID=UPI00404B561D
MTPPANHPPPPFFWGETPEQEYYESHNVRNSKSYFQTPNGQIFTQSWLSLDQTQPVKAVIFMTHGYTADTSWVFKNFCIAYAKWGYAVFSADLLGHGRSDGLHGYIGDMDKAAATSLSYFVCVRKSEEYCQLPAFLFGESMGALVTMLMYFQSDPGTWSGLIFSSPLFVLPEGMVPSKLHLTMYGLLFGLADTWAAMPETKMVTKAVRDKEKLKILVANPKRYAGKARVGTMREVVRVTDYLHKHFDKVKVPFFTAHGTSDGLACPSGSEMLYKKAETAKEYKCLKLYEGAYHSLVNGEPDEVANLVLADMKAWINKIVKVV